MIPKKYALMGKPKTIVGKIKLQKKLNKNSLIRAEQTSKQNYPSVIAHNKAVYDLTKSKQLKRKIKKIGLFSEKKYLELMAKERKFKTELLRESIKEKRKKQV